MPGHRLDMVWSGGRGWAMEESAVRVTVTFEMDGEVFDRLHRRAMGKAHSTEDEIQEILTQAVEQPSKDEAWKRINALRERLEQSGRVFSPSEDLIRQDRDEH